MSDGSGQAAPRKSFLKTLDGYLGAKFLVERLRNRVRPDCGRLYQAESDLVIARKELNTYLNEKE